MIVDIKDGYLPQQLLREYLNADNRADEALAHKSELTEQIIVLLFKGVPVEPGIHTARVRRKRGKRGRKVKIKLKVK